MLAEALVERVLGEGVQVLDRFPGAALDGVRYEPPFPFIAGERVRRARPHGAARRLRHRRRRHRPRPHRDRLRRGRLPPRRALRARPSSTRCGSTAPTTSASASTPGASSRTPTPTSSRTCARAAGCCAPSSYEHAYPHCWRSRRPAALLRQAVLVHRDVEAARPAARRQRAGQLAPRAHQARALRRLAREQRRLGAVARALLGHAAAGLALRGRQRARSSGRFDELEELIGRAARRPAPAVRRRRRRSRARSARADGAACPRSSTSGSTRARCRSRSTTRRSRTRSASRSSFPADFICEALDQTRGWFYSLLAVSTLLFDQPTYQQRRLPRADPRRARARRCRSPRATSSCPGRSSTASAPTRSAGTSSRPSSRGTATASPWRRSARACGSSCASCGTPTRSTRSTRRSASRPTAGTTDLDRWILSRLGATVEDVTERLEAYDATIAGRAIADVRRRPLQLVRAPLAPALLGGRRDGASRRCASAS